MGLVERITARAEAGCIELPPPPKPKVDLMRTVGPVTRDDDDSWHDVILCGQPVLRGTPWRR